MAVCLSAYNYTCVHIPGPNNVWADIISHWITTPIVHHLVSVPVLPSSSADDFIWPTHDELFATQAAHDALLSDDVSKDADGLYKNHFSAVWIPDVSDNPQLRFCVIAHTGASGHPAATATEHALGQNFFWSTMSADIETFVRSCIHCLSTVGGERSPVRSVPPFMALHPTIYCSLTTSRLPLQRLVRSISSWYVTTTPTIAGCSRFQTLPPRTPHAQL